MKTAQDLADETAQAIKDARKYANELARITREWQGVDFALEDAVVKIIAFDDAPKLQSLLKRIMRMRELRNMAELGSFSIEADKALSAAWERLP